MRFITTIQAAVAICAIGGDAFTLSFYAGTECNGENTDVITNFTNPDQCSTDGLTQGNAESVLITPESGDPSGAQIAFYSSDSCDTSQSPVVFDDTGCVDYDQLGANSYVIEVP